MKSRVERRRILRRAAGNRIARPLELLLAASLLIPSVALADDYRSGFELDISVPDVWLVLTQGEVARHADVFLGDGSASGDDAAQASVQSDQTSVLHAIPPDMRRTVFHRIQEGEIEIFYRREGQSGSFIDNVNLMHQITSLPESKEQLDSVCRILPSEFSRVFGRPVGLDACEMRDMVGRPALYLQFDGAVAGTKTMQYQIQRAPNLTFVMTATASNSNVARMLSEFEAMVSSIRFD